MKEFLALFSFAAAVLATPTKPIHARQTVNPDLPSDNVMAPGTFETTMSVYDRLNILKTIGDGGEGDPNSGAGIWVSPVFTDLFQRPFNIPVPLLPITTFVNETSNETIDYFEITVVKAPLEIYSNLTSEFEMYNGILPGPYLEATAGRHSVVRFINNVTNPISIHLHGSPSRPPWDGFASDTTLPGQFKDYFYPNESPRTLWYHDHALGITSRNVGAGQEGIYVVRNTTQDEEFDLPRGEYEVYIQIMDAKFFSDGTPMNPQGETEMFYGDIILANGVPWPVMTVEPRKYRFRLNDGSVNRTYKLRIETADGTVVPFTIIGSDGGLNEAPVPFDDLIIAIAERYEIVADFTGFENQQLFLRNSRNFSVNPDFAFTDFILAFNVSDTVTDQTGNGPLPASFGPLQFAPDNGTIDRSFRFERQNGDWRINGIGWSDPANPPVLADPPIDGFEVWQLENHSGGWAHPVHIHLIDFRVMSRTQRGVEPYEAAGFKDVVLVAENEVVTVVARYAPWTGVYMFHCHNLVHEDNDMLGTFDVNNTVASPASGDIFSNPLQAEFRSADMDPEAFTATAINTKLSFFSALGAYVKRAADEGIIG